MHPRIVPGNEYLVELDRFTVRVRALRKTALGWECETIPIGTRIVIDEEVFLGDFSRHAKGAHHSAGR